MMEESKIKYPTPSDLESVVNDYLHRGNLMNFLHRRGLFYFHVKHDQLAKQLSRLLLEYSSLNELRRMAHNQTSKSILTGFSLNSNESFDFDAIYNEVRNNGLSLGNDYQFKSIVKIPSATNEVKYTGSIKYRSKKAGKIQFIKEEEHDITFVATKSNDNSWLIEVDGNKSGDGKEVQKVIRKIVKGKNINVSALTLDKLEGKKPTIFFDELAKRGMGEEWTIVDITRITIRRPNIDEDDEDEEAQVEGENLAGIKQAILDGKGLRENKFVKDSEAQGYIFSSMSYRFRNKNNNQQIYIHAEFKGNPKIFEVVLDDVTSIGPDPDKDDPKFTKETSNLSKLSEKENFSIRSLFWKNAKEIYVDVLKSKD